MAGSQLAALGGRVDAKRAGGGEGGEGSDEEDLEVHVDGFWVVLLKDSDVGGCIVNDRSG